MNIYNLEIHKQCGLYSLPEDGSIKSWTGRRRRKSCSSRKTDLFQTALRVGGKGQVEINKLEVQVVGPGNVALVPCNSYLIASVEPGSYLLMVNFTEKSRLLALFACEPYARCRFCGRQFPSGGSQPANQRENQDICRLSGCLHGRRNIQ